MQDHYHALKKDLISALNLSMPKAQSGLSTILKSATPRLQESKKYTPVISSGLDKFPWQWSQLGTFNAATWDFLNHIATSEQNFISLTPGLTTWYYNVISATAYLWTDEDRATIDSLLADSSRYQNDIISGYFTIFKTIDPLEKKTAAAALGLEAINGLTYIVEYLIGFQWSGRQAAGLTPLSAAELRETNLDALFIKAPQNAYKVLLVPMKKMFTYEKMWALKIDDLWNKSTSIRNAADNTHSPELSNESGMQVVAYDGVNAVRHSFKVSPSVNDIRAQLASKTTMKVTLSAQQSTQSDAIVSVRGAKSMRVPTSFLTLEHKSGMSKPLLLHDGTGDEALINLTYHGLAEITIKATAFSWQNSTGWYYESPLKQAAMNKAQNSFQGYQFQLPVSYDLASGSGFLETLLICRAMTVEVVCPKGNFERLAQNIPTGSSVSATLFDTVKLKGAPAQPLIATIAKHKSSGAPSIILTSVDEGLSNTPGPLAHVIGATIYQPCKDLSASIKQHSPKTLKTAVATKSLIADTKRNQEQALVSVYEQVFGLIKPKQLIAAHASNKFNFIIEYIFGKEWSGCLKRNTAPVTVSAMQKARNLRELFPQMPIAGSKVMTKLHEYLSSK
jgi:hypothetical protein